MNAFTMEHVLQTASNFGAAVGAGKASPIDNAKFVFEASRQIKVDPVAYYKAYANGQNDADAYNAAIDLSNEKSLAAQASKLGVFVTLAASHPDQRADLIDRTVTIIHGLPGKKPSVYESVLKVARAQIKALAVNLTDEEILALVTPADAKIVTRVTSLEAMLAAAKKHGELFNAKDAAAIATVLRTLISAAETDAASDLAGK